jgi:hypothetical protein
MSLARTAFRECGRVFLASGGRPFPRRRASDGT